MADPDLVRTATAPQRKTRRLYQGRTKKRWQRQAVVDENSAPEQQLLLEKSSRSKLPEKRGIVNLWGK